VAQVDVVVVSYNSRDELRECVLPFVDVAETDVIVVDNASTDGTLASIADLPVQTIALEQNGGFAHGCNVGWRSGRSPYVLFLNPDARIEPEAVGRLVGALEENPRAGIAGPRIVHSDGSLDYSQRRFPRLRSTYARALFLHRVFPDATWTDEVVREHGDYERPGRAQWLSGASLLVRRTLLEQLSGMDESFFMYCEDKDLCRRAWAAGYEVIYEPTSVVVHLGGASAPRAALLPTLAASRAAYARKHMSTAGALAERLGLGLESLLRLVAVRGGRPARAGHLRSLGALASRPRQN
jgi:N-acetylglucosaminyl-diphospho-decaprenol L-rhamnosyltransferase